MSDRILVVGAGAWGMTAALQLQERGHKVTLIERFEVGNRFASSGGDTRLWRLIDTQLWRARSIIETLPAMERLSERLGQPVFEQTGVIWRDDESLSQVTGVMGELGIPFEYISENSVAEVFPGLKSDGRDAVFCELGGVVFAERLLFASLEAFLRLGGVYLPDRRVTSIDPREKSVSVEVTGGDRIFADQLLLSAGPGTRELLPGLGIKLPLQPYMEQLVFFGDPNLSPPAPYLPGLVDCPRGDEAGIYGMWNGMRGYKVGIDKPIRALNQATLGDDLNRDTSMARIYEATKRIRDNFALVVPNVLHTQVCTWTDSGDGDFIIGRTHPTVVLACGDSGEGFKYSAFMGEYLADLVEGGKGNEDYQTHWNPRRFANQDAPREIYTAIGRH